MIDDKSGRDCIHMALPVALSCHIRMEINQSHYFQTFHRSCFVDSVTDQCILQLTSLGIDSEMHSHGKVKDGVKCRSVHQKFEMVSSMADPLRVRCKPKHSSCNSL